MAQGSIIVFNDLPSRLGKSIWDFSSNSSPLNFKLSLITTIPAVTDSNAKLADYTEVSGGGYETKSLTLSWTTTASDSPQGDVATLSLNTTVHTNGKVTWTGTGGSPQDPTNIKGAIIWDDDATNDDVIIGYDMTEDGSTAIALTTSGLVMHFNAGGVEGRILTSEVI